jgi:hypothetical protein
MDKRHVSVPRYDFATNRNTAAIPNECRGQMPNYTSLNIPRRVLFRGNSQVHGPLYIYSIHARIYLTLLHFKATSFEIPFRKSTDSFKTSTVSPCVESEYIVPGTLFPRRILILRGQLQNGQRLNLTDICILIPCPSSKFSVAAFCDKLYYCTCESSILCTPLLFHLCGRKVESRIK